MAEKMRFILASASPRRKEILQQAGVSFEVMVSEEEEYSDKERPEEYVEELSTCKANNVAKRLTGDYVIIAADTVVEKDGKIYGKPVDESEAFHMLDELQGEKHHVHTGVTLLVKEGDAVRSNIFHVSTLVDVLSMTPGEIKAYIAKGECMDKAGAYAIQGCFAPYIYRIQGDYYNVVGLPISTIMLRLRDLGVAMIER